MVKAAHSESLQAFDFQNLLKNIPELKLLNCEIDTISFEIPLDSSNMNPTHWVTLAEIIEKHIALDNQKKGFDIDFSLKGKEIKKLRDDIDVAFKLLGKNGFFRNKSENKSKIFRRSIFTTKNIKKGEKFTKDNIRVIRPGYGLMPKYFNKILNKRSPVNISKDEPLKPIVLMNLY